MLLLEECYISSDTNSVRAFDTLSASNLGDVTSKILSKLRLVGYASCNNFSTAFFAC